MTNIGTTNFDLEVAKNKVDGHTIVLGIARREGQDPTVTDVDIQNGPTEKLNLLEVTSTVYMSSTSASDTGILMAAVGLNGDDDEQTGVATLNGQSQVAITGTWFRIFLGINISSTELQGDIYIAEADDLTNGVPDDLTKVLAKIDVGKNASQNGSYTVPRNKEAKVRQVTFTVNRGVNLVAKLLGRARGGVFITRNQTDIFENIVNNVLSLPSSVPALTDLKGSFITQNINTNIGGTYFLTVIDV